MSQKSSGFLLKNVKDSTGNQVELAWQDERFVNQKEITENFKILDGNGLTVIPGLVDLHTHLREPGGEDAETVLTGSQSAVAGGYTAISAMPNTEPAADTAGVVEQVFRLGQTHGLCDVFPIGAVTEKREGKKLAELAAMNASAAHVRIFSDDGSCISDALVMRRALEYVKSFNGIIAQHAQDPRLTEGAEVNEGVISSTLGLKGWPAVAEEAIIARDVLLAEHVNSRLHICHISTAGSVEIVRWAKSRGISVTAEVTPHHLLLEDELTRSYDPVFKVNPPLRNRRDVQALREGVADGTIDIIATDHAPHPSERKECEWSAASFGMVGLETALSVSFLALVQSGLITLSSLMAKMSSNPSNIAGYSGHGYLEVGALANFALIDLSKEWKVEKRALKSKSKNTPFQGMKLPVSVKRTYFKGREVFGSDAR